MLFAVATAGAADVAKFWGVSDIMDTLVMVKVRMINKATGTIVRDVFMLCLERRFGQYRLEDAISANSCRKRHAPTQQHVLPMLSCLFRTCDMRCCGSRFCSPTYS